MRLRISAFTWPKSPDLGLSAPLPLLELASVVPGPKRNAAPEYMLDEEEVAAKA